MWVGKRRGKRSHPTATMLTAAHSSKGGMSSSKKKPPPTKQGSLLSFVQRTPKPAAKDKDADADEAASASASATPAKHDGKPATTPAAARPIGASKPSPAQVASVSPVCIL